MKRIGNLLLLTVFLVGCSQAPPPAPPLTPALSNSPTLSVEAPTIHPTPPIEASPTPTAPTPNTIWLSGDLPPALAATFQLPIGMARVEQASQAGLRIEAGEGQFIARWVFVLAAPFPTFTDQTSLAELQALWLNGSRIGEEGKNLLVEKSTEGWLEGLWGRPSHAVRVLPAAELLDTAWKERSSWAILPFEQLEPRWKVLAVDGQSPIHKNFQSERYPLIQNIGLTGESSLTAALLESTPGLVSPTNRRSDHLTTLILTGTTAMVRATAALMELHGMDYPAQDIGPLLREADILHINNEISFAPKCPSPLPHTGLIFCSQERYIKLLEDIDTSVIDLSGDHLNDWGAEALRFTIDLYHQRGWQTYGGGTDGQEAKKAALFEHNGNKIALIGCNYKQPGYSQAGVNSPGAVHCDRVWLDPAIHILQADGYLPIVTLQDDEYMEAIARPKPKEDFGSAVDAGAALVSGTASHQPQAIAFKNGVFIHYGLGNLFFDQIHSWETSDQAFIDRHVIYEGRVISSELITTIFVDFARPRLMTSAERHKLLALIFEASGW